MKDEYDLSKMKSRPNPYAKRLKKQITLRISEDVIEYFKKEGKKVYEPDQNAFRTFAQKRYVDKYGKDWPKGALERINAIK